MKNNTLFFLGGLALFAFISSCSNEYDIDPEPSLLTPKEITLTSIATRAIQSSNEFGITLFTKVAEEEDQNFMLSPLSASTALTMLLNGCDGDTYTQLQGALSYPAGMSISEINEAYKSLVSQLLDADPKVKFALANAIFYKEGFNVKPPFLATMREDYKAAIDALNFAGPSALTTINKWANDNTNGKIPKVLDRIDPAAVMFLMNALYFNGDWTYQFDKSLTQDRPFYPDRGSSLNVKTMSSEAGTKIYYGSNFKAVEMPYGRTNFTMIVIVPEESLREFYPSFTPQSWSQLTSEFDMINEFKKFKVLMPKFKFTYEKILNDQLQSMGMVDAFIPFQANLSGISDASIFVSFVKQNTFVDVDEEGTEAAAVTTIGIAYTSVNPQPREFVIDKSFFFAIRERTTNTLLFTGQVMNPED